MQMIVFCSILLWQWMTLATTCSHESHVFYLKHAQNPCPANIFHRLDATKKNIQIFNLLLVQMSFRIIFKNYKMQTNECASISS